LELENRLLVWRKDELEHLHHLKKIVVDSVKDLDVKCRTSKILGENISECLAGHE
jgi:hypothetical protein